MKSVMELTLKNLRSSLGKDLLKVAAKCAVRECDENEKGKFVAYVDEGNDSYDVSIELNETGKFIAFSCDCKSDKKICQHKAALMMFVSSAPEAKAKQLPKAKLRESEMLASEVKPELLLEWIKERLRSDKEFELAFLSAFRPVKVSLDPEKVRQMTVDAQKAVIGRNRNIDAKMISRLLSLWNKVHEPAIKYYVENPVDYAAFTCYISIVEHLLEFSVQYYFNSVKYNNYLDELKVKGFGAVQGITHDDTWKIAIGYYIKAAFVPDRIGGYFLEQLMHLVNSQQKQRRIFLAEAILDRYSSRDESERRYQYQLSYLMLKLSVEQGLFNKYSSLFNKPLDYSPYDSLLIETLISVGQYDKAIDISEPIAFSGRYPERQLQHLKILKGLHQKTGNTAELLKVMQILVPLTYDFNGYRFLSEHLAKSEFESIKSAMYHKAISSMHARGDMFEFVFSLLAEEKEYSRMIRYLPKTQSYELIIPWLEVLAAYDKDECFNGLLKITDAHFNHAARLSAEKLAALTFEIYPVDYIRTRLSAHLIQYRNMYPSTYIRILAQRFEFS